MRYNVKIPIVAYDLDVIIDTDEVDNKKIFDAAVEKAVNEEQVLHWMVDMDSLDKNDAVKKDE